MNNIIIFFSILKYREKLEKKYREIKYFDEN